LTDMGRQQYPPWGLNGGKPGMTSTNLMKLPGSGSNGDDALEPVNVIRHLVPAGTVVVVATAGGGGWGEPMQRDPERVRWDVIEGYVSLAAAKHEYGVELDPQTLDDV